MIEMLENPRMHELFVPMYKSQLEKTKRCLFGPPDPDQTEQFLREERARQLAHGTDTWGFDFHLGMPLDRGDFVWTPATPPRSRAAARPRKQRTRPQYDNSECYFQHPCQDGDSSQQNDGYFKPITPVKVGCGGGGILLNLDRLKVSSSTTAPPSAKPAAAAASSQPKQTRITDFMVQKKRPALVMKEDKSAADRPITQVKKARIAEDSSTS